ncbi:uncharacterized protein BYT42DRAFT_346145 [Radiomyces spectabilis]|uniref:uncharacterized protein n=1 Tax=Radiomyces spectabilis TaxID=64574 RepID=UPI00221EC150|nr:uncharacterized protein BYT42DRAFT_346145 [Radiomyces spectabilis]KAI8377488.1 hypothetical protein BYT42DRAFT_346145 [Radiomyces spectabilis]
MQAKSSLSFCNRFFFYSIYPMSDNTALQQESPVRIIENSPTPVEIAAPSNTDHITADQPLNSTENNTTAAEDTVASELPQDTTPKCEQDKSDTEKAQFEKDDANKAPNSNDLGLSEETEAKPATESSTSDSATKKTTLSKRRTLFNPFFKSKKEDQSPKKEETSAPAEPSQEELDASDSTENASEAPAAPEKKKSKGFASLFSRSKSTPKAAQSTHSSPAVEDDTASTTTELPPIEQFQPIETEAVVNECKDDVPQVVTPENHDQVQVETSEAKKDEPNTESEQIKPAEASDEQGEVATSSPATEEDKPVTTMQPQKRQSFISKLFGKKKHPKEEKPEPVIKEEPKEETKQYKQEEIEDSDASSGPVEPGNDRMTMFVCGIITVTGH